MKIRRAFFTVLFLAVCAVLFATPAWPQESPPSEAFKVLPAAPDGPNITPFLQYQIDEAWKLDAQRQKFWSSLRTEKDLLQAQRAIRQKLLDMIGGLPSEKTELHARVTGTIRMDGYSIEKLIYESLPGIYVTALVYVPDDHSVKHPAVLVPAGHSTNGKIHYQALCQRLVSHGYVVIAWDPVGQGERSQFWDAKSGKTRYNLVCAEHAVIGNLAYLAGANLARWEVWDGMRAVDYLLTRADVDGERISITGTSGGGTQTALIAALDPRIKVAAPSCYISSLPMRIANRIFVDPDSDPEQDLYGMLSRQVDHAGLLLLMYPRPVMVASAVLDFFPIEGARKTFREAHELYAWFGHGERMAMVEGYHQHQFSPANQEAAIRFLDHFNNLPARKDFPTTHDLPDKDLLCTKSGQVMVDEKGARPLMDEIREYYEAHKGGVQAKGLKDEYLRGAPAIRGWKVSEFAGIAPHEGTIAWESAGNAKFDEVTIDKFVLHHSGALQMPLLYFHRESGGRETAALWFKENGKATAADWGTIKKLIAAGRDVISFDFRGLGETRMRYTAVSPDDPALGKLDFDHAYMNSISGVMANHVYNSLLTGRAYVFQMIDDTQVAMRFAEEKLGARIESVGAEDLDATPLAAMIAETVSGVKLEDSSRGKAFSWAELVEQKQEIWPIQYLLPGGAYVH